MHSFITGLLSELGGCVREQVVSLLESMFTIATLYLADLI